MDVAKKNTRETHACHLQQLAPSEVVNKSGKVLDGTAYHAPIGSQRNYRVACSEATVLHLWFYIIFVSHINVCIIEMLSRIVCCTLMMCKDHWLLFFGSAVKIIIWRLSHTESTERKTVSDFYCLKTTAAHLVVPGGLRYVANGSRSPGRTIHS